MTKQWLVFSGLLVVLLTGLLAGCDSGGAPAATATPMPPAAPTTPAPVPPTRAPATKVVPTAAPATSTRVPPSVVATRPTRPPAPATSTAVSAPAPGGGAADTPGPGPTETVEVVLPPAVPTAQAGLAVQDFGGEWASPEWGRMHLAQRGDEVKGTYEYADGQIIGLVQGNVLTFQWWEGAPGQPYEQASGRGPGYFILDADGMAFAGEWAYEGLGNWNGPWTATRLTPPTLTAEAADATPTEEAIPTDTAQPEETAAPTNTVVP